jgi:hypothetical protein
MIKPNAAQEDWDLLRSFFPVNWQELAKVTGALKGLRQDKSAESCLRVLLLHLGCGYSLRETVVRAKQAGLAELSDVALLKRLRKSKEWLCRLCRMRDKKPKRHACLAADRRHRREGTGADGQPVAYSLQSALAGLAL